MMTKHKQMVLALLGLVLPVVLHAQETNPNDAQSPERRLPGTFNLTRPGIKVDHLAEPNASTTLDAKFYIGALIPMAAWTTVDSSISSTAYPAYGFAIMAQVAMLAWANGYVFDPPSAFAAETMKILTGDQCKETIPLEGAKCKLPFQGAWSNTFYEGNAAIGLNRSRAVVGPVYWAAQVTLFSNYFGTPTIGFSEGADRMGDKTAFPAFVRVNVNNMRNFHVGLRVLMDFKFTIVDQIMCKTGRDSAGLAVSQEDYANTLGVGSIVQLFNPDINTGYAPGSAGDIAYLNSIGKVGNKISFAKKEMWDGAVAAMLSRNAHAHLNLLDEACGFYDIIHYLKMQGLVGGGHFWTGLDPKFSTYEGTYVPMITSIRNGYASDFAMSKPLDGFVCMSESKSERRQYKDFKDLMAYVGDNQNLLPAWLQNKYPVEAFRNLGSKLWLDQIDLVRPAALNFADAVMTAVRALNQVLLTVGSTFTDKQLLKEIQRSDFEGIGRRVRFNAKGDPILPFSLINYVYDASFKGYSAGGGMPTGVVREVGYYETAAVYTANVTFYGGRTGPPGNKDFPCAFGQYYVREHGICSLCAPGQKTDKLGMAVCDLCQPGDYSNSSGSGRCEQCKLGLYIDIVGATGCLDCPAGRFNDGTGQSQCKICQAGTYSAARAERCTLCDKGFYAQVRDSTTCTACNAGFTTRSIGADGIDKCLCDEGHFRGDTDRSRCEPCPTGLVCGLGSDTQNFGFYRYPFIANSSCKSLKECVIPIADVEYMTFETDPMKPWKCTSKEMCPGGLPGTCGGGLDPTQVACGGCPAGMRQSRYTCEECIQPPDSIPVVFCVPVIVLVLCLVIWNANRDKMMERKVSLLFSIILTIVIGTLQTLSMFSSLSIQWFEPMGGGVNALRFLQFDPQVLRPGCAMTVNPTLTFVGRQLIPSIMLVAILVILFIAKYILKREVDIYVYSMNTIGTVFYGLFISMISSSVMPFVCYPHPGGEWSMVSEPSVICWVTDRHKMFCTIAVILFVAVPVPYLAVVVWATLNHARFCRLGAAGDNRQLIAFRFLFHRFEFHAYYYAGIAIVRGLLICLLPAVIAKDPVWQLCILACIILGIAMIGNTLQPWRAAVGNYTEAALNAMLVLLIVCGAANSDLSANTQSVTNFAIVILSLTAFALLCAVAQSVYRMLKPHTVYDVCLTCNPSDAGAQARLLKLLMNILGLEVIMDNDCNDDADMIFDLLKTSVKNIAIFLTRNCLSSAICAGEIAIANSAKLRMVGLQSADFVEPMVHDMQHLAGYLDVSKVSLGQLGIAWNMVKVAFEALLNGPEMIMLDSLPSDWRARFNEVTKLFTPRPSPIPEVNDPRPNMLVFSVDSGDDDAVASAGIVALKMTQIRPDAGSHEDFYMLLDYMPEDSTKIVIDNARAIVVLFSSGSLANKMQLQTIRVAMDRYAEVHGGGATTIQNRSLMKTEIRKSFKVGVERPSDLAGKPRKSTILSPRQIGIAPSKFEVIGAQLTGFYFPMMSAYEVLFPDADAAVILNVQTLFNRLTAKVTTEATDLVLDMQIKIVSLWLPAGKAQGGKLNTTSGITLEDPDVEVVRPKTNGNNTETVWV